MKVVYVNGWKLRKPSIGYWYPVVFAKELVEQEKKDKQLVEQNEVRD